MDVIYTPWSNLKKTASMDVGQIGFHNQKLVKKVFLERKNNEIINRLRKTKREVDVDFKAERERFDKQMQAERKVQRKEAELTEKENRRMKKEEQEMKHFTALADEDHLKETEERMKKYEGNFDAYEDDFM